MKKDQEFHIPQVNTSNNFLLTILFHKLYLQNIFSYNTHLSLSPLPPSL